MEALLASWHPWHHSVIEVGRWISLVQLTNVTQPTQLTNPTNNQTKPTNSDPTNNQLRPKPTTKPTRPNPIQPFIWGAGTSPPPFVIRDFLEPKQHYHGACKHGLRSPSPEKFSRNDNRHKMSKTLRFLLRFPTVLRKQTNKKNRWQNVFLDFVHLSRVH